MPVRQIEVYIPKERIDDLKDIVSDFRVLGLWIASLDEDARRLAKIVVPAEETEKLVESITKSCISEKDLKILILPVEAVIPRPDQKKEKPEEGEKTEKKPQRISRQEIYVDISETAKLSWVYISFVVISTVLAAIGLIRGNVIVTIGAMVIAPFLGPNIALALATTLVDKSLAVRAFKANITGIFTSIFIAFLIGYIFPVKPEMFIITPVSEVNVTDIVVAMASGFAGALSFTTGIPLSLVGVMVAIALLPPLVGCGLLLGSGHYHYAFGALLLFLTNLIAINLSGVFTFSAQGIHPSWWWEKKKAKKATYQAAAIWTALLIVLVVFIYFSQKSS